MALVRAGGAVGEGKYVPQHIETASLVATLSIAEKIVSAAVIKWPDPGYVAKVEAKSKCEIGGDRAEFGYLVTDAGHRGRGYGSEVSTKLLNAFEGRLFSTTSCECVEGILRNCGFVNCGDPYPAAEQRRQDADGLVARLRRWCRPARGVGASVRFGPAAGCAGPAAVPAGHEILLFVHYNERRPHSGLGYLPPAPADQRVLVAPSKPNLLRLRRTVIVAVSSARLATDSLSEVRHTAATLNLLAGEHPSVIQQQLGHASIRTTQDVYGRLAPSTSKEAADRYDRMMRR